MRIAGSSMLTVLSALMICCSRQTIELPRPTGVHPVGTRYLSFADSSRPEVFTDDTADCREITARIWYPAENAQEAARAPYFMKPQEVVARFNYPPSFLFMTTHSRPDAPISDAEKSYPVLIFNHGWGEHFSQNTVLMEELASHGYFVLSIAHHHEARFSYFPDGRLILLDDSSQRSRAVMEEQSNPQAFAVFQKFSQTRKQEDQNKLFRQTTELMPMFLRESPRIWAQDIRLVIDELQKANSEDALFAGMLDLDRLGVFGMSMGGIASAQACFEDSRIRAGINMDGGLYGDILDTTISQPFVFMSSERYCGYDSVFFEHTRDAAYTVTIREAGHYNFHDFSILNPSVPQMGEIDGYRMLIILNEYTRAFFDKHLKNDDSGLLNDSSTEYPEVEIQLKNNGS
jgi:predicted dienelactone hydrolase